MVKITILHPSCTRLYIQTMFEISIKSTSTSRVKLKSISSKINLWQDYTIFYWRISFENEMHVLTRSDNNPGVRGQVINDVIPSLWEVLCFTNQCSNDTLHIINPWNLWLTEIPWSQYNVWNWILTAMLIPVPDKQVTWKWNPGDWIVWDPFFNVLNIYILPAQTRTLLYYFGMKARSPGEPALSGHLQTKNAMKHCGEKLFMKYTTKMLLLSETS